MKEFTRYYFNKVYISPQVDETKLTFKNKSRRVKIIKLVEGRQYLDQHHSTKQEREKITNLDASRKLLEGNLYLTDFINLKELDCSCNKLVSLNLTNCQKLEKIVCSDNLLTKLILPTNPANLKILDLRNNNFSTQDLSFLELCTNLEYLHLENKNEEKIKRVIYNRFTGSLNHLSGMKQLKYLNIGNTDINEVDIDKLPSSLRKGNFWGVEGFEKIWRSTNKRPNCELTQIVPQLKRFGYYGHCQKCQQLNTSIKWCQPCAEKEWKGLEGKELVKKFIQ
ncbi:MAG: hypothetical protein MRERC_7c009 [Mycoplasmataceae bacterium RC_NB112A]|nr:MAG: hypothetical protein MRERC_10c045 [Mycoplasmataceae bacterium RC_NB112A]KLL01858.1 MAG: hypothetical protein MRERC_7c009 [Mycoplasmataceae bacterium RC_NB112A]